MNWLTKQEQMILCIVLSLFLLGLSVKAYRLATRIPEAVQAKDSSDTKR